jgi:hypothetical protein
MFCPISPVSFPHYFLQANGHLAEQLKTREWIVARITSITERIADNNVRRPRFAGPRAFIIAR